MRANNEIINLVNVFHFFWTSRIDFEQLVIYTYHTTTRSSMETGCVSRDIPYHHKKTRQWGQRIGFLSNRTLLASASNVANCFAVKC